MHNHCAMIMILLIALVISGCAARMYGKLECDGPCSLTLEREISEADIIPAPIQEQK
jgi:PBP1b-binding outer membrane lipoprotein LpoB